MAVCVNYELKQDGEPNW